MEELQQLFAAGRIYDGCIVRAQGTVRFKDGEVYIESMRDLVDIGGENFEKLCHGEGRAKPANYEDTRTAAQLEKELLEMKQGLIELNSKNAILTNDLSKAMSLADALKKQIDDDQNFSTNTIYDLTKKISDLQEQLKEETVAQNQISKDLRQELESLRQSDVSQRNTIATLQQDIRAFEAHKALEIEKLRSGHEAEIQKMQETHQVENARFEQQINLLHEELSMKSSMDPDTASTTSEKQVDKVKSTVKTKYKLKQLFGSKKSKAAANEKQAQAQQQQQPTLVQGSAAL